jgi:hypothetical protein
MVCAEDNVWLECVYLEDEDLRSRVWQTRHGKNLFGQDGEFCLVISLAFTLVHSISLMDCYRKVIEN